MKRKHKFVSLLLALMLPTMWLLTSCSTSGEVSDNKENSDTTSETKNEPDVSGTDEPDDPDDLITVQHGASGAVNEDGAALYELGELTTSSPDGHIKALFWQDESNGLYYSIKADETEVITPSKLGLVLSECSFSEGIEEIKTYDSANEIDDSYETALTVSLANVSCRDHCMERDIFLEKSEGSLTLKIRVYDDGFALRYADVKAGSGDSVTVTDELTEINLPEDTTIFAGGYSATYEFNYVERTYDQFEKMTTNFNTPFTALTGDRWLLFSESDVYANEITYVKSVLSTESGSGKLCWKFGFKRDPANEVTDDLASPGHIRITEVNTSNGFTTPWRAAIIADDLNELLNSEVIDSLAPVMDESLFESTDWIKPGKVSWSWWSGVSQTDYNAQVDYVDFAAENGWEYCCLDAGWPVFEDRIAELCDYAAEKGVGIILWVNYLHLKTPEEIEDQFSQWSDWGVVGVKTDYFESDDIDVLEVMRNCAEIGAKYKLMIYFHGCINPCGETRTYPNIMSSEAVQGEEFRKWGTTPSPVNCLMYPFTRNITGSMDYTPSCIAIPSVGESGGFSLAKAIVYESAFQHFAGSAYLFPSFIGLPLLNRIPCAWDSSTVFEGYPGKYITYIRQSGDDFYIGSMTIEKRTVKVPLDFLGDGSYNAYIYYDDENGQLALEVQSVTSVDPLTLEMGVRGGAAVMITKDEVDTEVEASINSDLEGYTYYECEDGKMLGSARVSSSIMCSGGQKAGYVGSGSANAVEMTVSAPTAGSYEMIIYYCSGERRPLEVIINGETYKLTGLVSGGFDSLATVSLEVALEGGDNTVTFTSSAGYAPDLDRIAVSDEPNE